MPGQVFRRITALATRVLTYYQKRAPLELATASFAGASADGATAASSPPPPQQQQQQQQQQQAATGGGASLLPNASASSVALEDLLLWLVTYRDLFTKKCAATGKLMAWDPSVQYPVPPVFRPFK